MSALLARKSRALFCAADLLLMLVLLVRTPTAMGAAIMGVLAVILCVGLLVGENGKSPAGGGLALIAFVDVLMLLGLHLETLRAGYQPLADLHQAGRQWILLAAVGVAAGVLGVVMQKLRALTWLGAGLIGTAVILRAFADGSVFSPLFFPGGKLVLAAFLVLLLIWLYIAQLTLQTAPGVGRSVTFMGLLLLVCAVALLLLETQLITELAWRFALWLAVSGEKAFALWRVALCAAVLAGGAIALRDTRKKTVGPDALLLASGAGWALLAKAVLHWYFPFAPLALLLYAWAVCYVLQNELFARKTLELGNERFLGAALLTLLLAVFLIHAGQWPLVAVCAVLGLVLSSEVGLKRSDARADFRWMLGLCAIAALALAWVWKMRFAEATIAVILLLLLFAALSMAILAWPHPNGRRAPVSTRAALCAMLGLLCAIPMARHGVRVQVVPDLETDTVQVTAAARGRGNAVAHLAYYWTDARGRALGDPVPIDGEEAELDIEAACLTVIAGDAYGIQTIHTSFTPYDFGKIAAALAEQRDRQSGTAAQRTAYLAATYALDAVPADGDNDPVGIHTSAVTGGVRISFAPPYGVIETIDAQIADSDGGSAARWFDLEMDADEGAVSVLLAQEPPDGAYTLRAHLYAADGSLLAESSVRLMAGVAGRPWTDGEGEPVAAGVYRLRSASMPELALTYGDGAFFLDEMGRAFSVSPAQGSGYYLTNPYSPDLYLAADPQSATPLRIGPYQDDGSCVWHVRSGWLFGTGPAWLLGVRDSGSALHDLGTDAAGNAVLLPQPDLVSGCAWVLEAAEES